MSADRALKTHGTFRGHRPPLQARPPAPRERAKRPALPKTEMHPLAASTRKFAHLLCFGGPQVQYVGLVARMNETATPPPRQLMIPIPAWAPARGTRRYLWGMDRGPTGTADSRASRWAGSCSTAPGDASSVLGWSGLVQALPVIVLAIPAGQLSDKRSRRTILMVTMVAAAFCSLGLALLSWRTGPVWAYYAVLAAGATANAIGWPARPPALVPQLVPTGAVGQRDHLNSTTFSARVDRRSGASGGTHRSPTAGDDGLCAWRRFCFGDVPAGLLTS